MKRSRVLLLVLTSALMAGCVTSGDDFLVKGKARQKIPLEGAKAVVVRCYCPKTAIKTTGQSTDVVIDAVGEYGSGGYHGKQDKPTSMPRSLLAFSARNDGAQLILESKESTYMHHFNFLTKVTVTVPTDVQVRFEPIARNDLYDRSSLTERQGQ